MKKLKRGTKIKIEVPADPTVFNAIVLAQSTLHFVVLITESLPHMPILLMQEIIDLDDGVECDEMYKLLAHTSNAHILGHIETLKCVTGNITDQSNTPLTVTLVDEEDVTSMDICTNLCHHVQHLEDWVDSPVADGEFSDICIGMLRDIQTLKERLMEADAACDTSHIYNTVWMNRPFLPQVTPRKLVRSCFMVEL